MSDKPTFKLRDLVEVTDPQGPTFHGLVSVVVQERPAVVSRLDNMMQYHVKPEWCRLVPKTLIVKDGEWSLE